MRPKLHNASKIVFFKNVTFPASIDVVVDILKIHLNYLAFVIDGLDQVTKKVVN